MSLPQHDTVHPHDKTTADIIKSVRIITALPEIAQTKVLSTLIQTHLVKDFIVNQLDATTGPHNLCRYATSHPVMCFYHSKKYFLNSTVFASATLSLELTILMLKREVDPIPNPSLTLTHVLL